MKVNTHIKEKNIVRTSVWRLSVIIPTLNEVAYLPTLLEALAAQTCPADEIIVADAGSTDGTAELARRRGTRVVRGGMPAVGRNAGAKVASGELLFFLDADVIPPPDFLEHAVTEFQRKGYDVATVVMTPWDGNLLDQVVHEAANLYFLLMQFFKPYAPGFCILARREIHEVIGGFDETLYMTEDQDYVRRAARHGHFGILTSTHIPVSMRRIRKEGLIGLGMKYLWCETNLLMGKPIYQIPFEYEFGAFSPPLRKGRQAKYRLPLSVSSLRQTESFRQLVRSTKPLQLSFSIDLSRLYRLLEERAAPSRPSRLLAAPRSWVKSDESRLPLEANSKCRFPDEN